jgi:hypothetical protein
MAAAIARAPRSGADNEDNEPSIPPIGVRTADNIAIGFDILNSFCAFAIDYSGDNCAECKKTLFLTSCNFISINKVKLLVARSFNQVIACARFLVLGVSPRPWFNVKNTYT